MTLQQARALRDTIRAEGIHCTVPGGWRPDNYFAQIWPGRTALRLHSVAEWEAYKQQRDAQRQKLNRPRSPLDAMIDRACGVTEADYE